MKFRVEKDSLGEVKVPAKALWGAQTQRAVNNFPISGIKMDFPFTKSFVTSLGLIKDAAAKANLRLKLISTKNCSRNIYWFCCTRSTRSLQSCKRFR